MFYIYKYHQTCTKHRNEGLGIAFAFLSLKLPINTFHIVCNRPEAIFKYDRIKKPRAVPLGCATDTFQTNGSKPIAITKSMNVLHANESENTTAQ